VEEIDSIIYMGIYMGGGQEGVCGSLSDNWLLVCILNLEHLLLLGIRELTLS